MRRLAGFTRAEGMRVRVFDADREQAPASSPQGGVLIPRQLLRRVGQGPLHPLLSFCQRKKKAFVGRGARRGENSDNGAESRRSHSSAKADHRFNEAPTPHHAPFSPTPPAPSPGPGPWAPAAWQPHRQQGGCSLCLGPGGWFQSVGPPAEKVGGQRQHLRQTAEHFQNWWETRKAQPGRDPNKGQQSRQFPSGTTDSREEGQRALGTSKQPMRGAWERPENREPAPRAERSTCEARTTCWGAAVKTACGAHADRAAPG